MLMRPYSGRMSSWREMDRLRREMNRLFSEWPSQVRWGVAASYPAINVWTDEDSALVTAEMPGVSLDDLEITVESDTLTLRGTRQLDELTAGAKYHRRERRHGAFVRTFRLPFPVEADEVNATFEKGVLNVSLPRSEADKPRKISIKAG